jgi:hypothetical protein
MRGPATRSEDLAVWQEAHRSGVSRVKQSLEEVSKLLEVYARAPF